MTRTDHSDEAGFIYESPKTGAVVYLAEEQGMDVGGDKYAIVCVHGSVAGSSSKKDAKIVANWPGNFCPACDDLFPE